MEFRKTKRMRVVLVLLPVALTSVALFVVSGQRREIMNLFTLVPGTEGCTLLSGSMWRSNTEVVCVPAFRGGTQLLGVDARSGKQKPLASPPTNQGIFGSFGVMVSPNGKWLLWPGGMSEWNAMRLDGKGMVQRPRASTNMSDLEVAWLPDSSGWAESHEQEIPDGTENGMRRVKYRRFVRICSLKTSEVREIEVPQATQINDFQVTQKGEMVFSCADSKGVRFVTMSLSPPLKLREQTIKPAFNANGSTLVSPRGDRIAWTSQNAKGDSVTESVWLSDIDGKNFKRLTPELEKYTLAPIYLHWRPDGRSLSCWRQKSLWVLNIP